MKLRIVPFLVLVGLAAKVSGQAARIIGYFEDAECSKFSMDEIYRDETAYGSKKVCCCNGNDPASHTFFEKQGKECRHTPCLSATSPNLCSSLDKRVINGETVEYEEILRESCSEGAVGLCCPVNSTEALLSTSLGANQNEFPHQVVVKLPGGPCGGTIYNKRFIITASHCVVDYEGTRQMLEASTIQIYTGTNIWDYTEPENIYNVKRLIPHPQFSKLLPNPDAHDEDQGMYNDLALIEVDKDIKFGPNVKALEMAPSGFEPLDYSDRAVVVGWGITDTLSQSKHLQKANFLVRKNDLCFADGPPPIPWGIYRGNKLTKWSPQLLCLGGYMKGKRSYMVGKGDSGGPAICRGPDGKILHCGVVSFAAPFENCHTSQDESSCLPSVFARVSAFQDWVKGIAKEQDPSTLYQPYLYGKKASKAQSAHQVHITSADGKPCGGTLVSPDLVVTAAQCIAYDQGGTMSRNGVVVTHGLNGDLNGKGKSYEVDGYTMLPGFKMVGQKVDATRTRDRQKRLIDPVDITKKENVLNALADNYYKNDIALIKLKEKVPISQSSLPGLPTETPKGLGTELTFSRDPTNKRMMAHEFKFMDRSECQSKMGRLSRLGMKVQLDQNLLCGVETYSGGSTCDRELGGGVICKDDNGNSVLCGIQIFRMCEYSIPNGFIDVAQYKEWIQKKM